MNEEDMNQIIAGWVIHYLHQDISESELKELYQWLQESPENKEFFFQIKNIYDSTRHHRLMSAEELEGSWQRMQSRLSSYSSTTSPIVSRQAQALGGGKKFFLRSFRYMAVASVAAIVGFGVSLLIQPRLAENLKVKEVSYNEIHVPKGGKPGSITLSDGTKVQLNVAGTLRYPTGFSGNCREVYLNGEAWFEVSHDAAKPFIVHLNRQDIIVHGTSFNAEAYHSEPYSVVTLLDGSISLETSDSKGECISQMFIKPGQKANFDKVSEHIYVENADATMSNAWTRGEYKFKDEPLGLIVKRLENYYNVRIMLDSDLKDIRYTGTFSFSQSIIQALNIINYEKQFSFRHKDGDEILISKQ
jgi:ferric-dicitrate binding protein FerR (iron transport regulator)